MQQERQTRANECDTKDTSKTRVTQVQHECYRSAKTRMLHERHDSYTGGTSVLARSRIVTFRTTALFSIKITLCETNNIIFSKNYSKLWKTNARFWKNILKKGKVTLDRFRNFTCVSSYLYLKTFAWKRNFRISSKH